MAKGFAIAVFKGDSLEVALAVRASGELVKTGDYQFSLKIGERSFAGEPSADGRRVLFRLAPAITTELETGEHRTQLVIDGADYRKTVNGVLNVGDPAGDEPGFACESIDFELDVPPLSINLAALVNMFPQECRNHLDGVAASAAGSAGSAAESAAAAGASAIGAKSSESAASSAATLAVQAADRAAAAAAAIVDACVYGIDHDTAVATAATACTRVVLVSGYSYLAVPGFTQMPAHNWRRCVVDDLAARHVKYYLHPQDSTRRADGAAAVLTGADGDVMVQVPVVYRRTDQYTDASGHLHRVHLVSDRQFANSAPFDWFKVGPGGATVREQFMGAFPAALCDASGAALTTVESTAAPAVYSAGCRLRSIAGAKPVANMDLPTMRTAANAAGGRTANEAFYEFLALMMAVEYGTFDLQSAFSPGFTNADSAAGYAHVRLNGRANFGNGSGHIPADPVTDAIVPWQAGTADAAKVVQCVYRGIQDPYGALWQFADGFVMVPDGFYRTFDPALYSDTNYAATHAKIAHAWPSTGWMSSWAVPSMLPLAAAGSSTSGLCDYYYYYDANPHRMMRGGGKTQSVSGGPFCVNIQGMLSITATGTGGRTAC
ncbi:MAG: hypothetical protein AB7F40_07860 [Victivallaceae bacterium]|nr:hypothetical protein [Victivallaceae bacterium]